MSKLRKKNLEKYGSFSEFCTSIEKSVMLATLHVSRFQEGRWEKKVEIWIPEGAKRARGGPMTRWWEELREEIGSKQRVVAANCEE